ncbi:MAG: hypothetical protein ACRBDL_08265 [Alphaproteobacteria bacterium]
MTEQNEDNEQENIIQDTVIHEVKISDEYKDIALKQVRKAVKGNKYDPQNVKLEKFEGALLQFQAENMLTVLKKVTQKKVAGRVQGPVKVENEQAALESINKAYLTLEDDKDTERKIREVVLNRDDQGFAVDNNIIPLPFWHKEFVVFEPCHTCRTTGSVKCLPCDGKGLDRCPRCNGSGMDHCKHCHGAQMVMGQNNQKTQCPVCHGSGRSSCTSCNQSGQVRCATCKSKGITPCPNCNGNAWNSHIFVVDLEARTAFDYPKNKLPEKVVEAIERQGAKLKEDADITISESPVSIVNIDDDEKMRQQEEADKRRDYRIPIIYNVELPYGHVEYDINGHIYYTFLFGTKGKLEHVSPFLDTLIKNGMRKLHDAAEERGDVIGNLKAAAEYRTVKEAIFYTATYSLNKAKALLKKTNTLGLSPSAINDLVETADTSLKLITKKPRLNGFGIASALSLILIPAYLLSPIRDTLIAHSPKLSVDMVIDALAIGLIFYLGVTAIQWTAQSAIRRAMDQIMPKKTEKLATPKLGQMAYTYAGLNFVICLVTLEIARQAGVNPVLWYTSIFN